MRFINLWKNLDWLSRLLVAIALALALGILFGSILALARPRPARQAAQTELPTASLNEGGEQGILEIGRIRASSPLHRGDKAGPTSEQADIIISLSFPYDKTDIAFGEELLANKHLFREDCVNFFRQSSLKDLEKMGDTGLRQELLRLFNNRLLLGKIKTIWLVEYLVIE